MELILCHHQLLLIKALIAKGSSVPVWPIFFIIFSFANEFMIANEELCPLRFIKQYLFININCLTILVSSKKFSWLLIILKIHFLFFFNSVVNFYDLNILLIPGKTCSEGSLGNTQYFVSILCWTFICRFSSNLLHTATPTNSVE